MAVQPTESKPIKPVWAAVTIIVVAAAFLYCLYVGIRSIGEGFVYMPDSQLEQYCEQHHAVAVPAVSGMDLENVDAIRVSEVGDFIFIGPEMIGADFPSTGTMLITQLTSTGFITGREWWVVEFTIGEVTREIERVHQYTETDVVLDLGDGTIEVTDREEVGS